MDYRRVTSRQNTLVKDVCALALKKHRKERGEFRFDGVKLLREALACRARLCNIIVREDKLEALSELLYEAERAGLVRREDIVAVTDEVFEKISEERSPEGVICVARELDGLHLKASAVELAELASDGERILIAESLRDAGNLGTVIRGCAALGIDRLILTDDCADIYSQKTVRAAMGAAFRQKTVTVAADELADAIRALRAKGRRIYATALHREALAIGELKLTKRDAFVIGNEGHGLSESTVAACDACAVIPMAENAESLNAAVAAAICIWETVRA